MYYRSFRHIDSDVAGMVFAIAGIIILVAIVVQIFYLLTLQNAMKQVSPELRKMTPGQVWLTLIPVFGIIWAFIMVGYIADSLGPEFRRRNMPVDSDRPGYQIGILAYVFLAAGILPIPVLSGLLSLAGIIMWIMYWVKISGYKNQLEQNQMMFPPMGNQPPYPPQSGYQQYPPQQGPQNYYPPNQHQGPHQ